MPDDSTTDGRQAIHGEDCLTTQVFFHFESISP